MKQLKLNKQTSTSLITNSFMLYRYELNTKKRSIIKHLNIY